MLGMDFCIAGRIPHIIVCCQYPLNRKYIFKDWKYFQFMASFPRSMGAHGGFSYGTDKLCKPLIKV